MYKCICGKTVPVAKFAKRIRGILRPVCWDCFYGDRTEYALLAVMAEDINRLQKNQVPRAPALDEADMDMGWGTWKFRRVYG